MCEVCPVCQAPVAAGAAVCPQCGFKLLGATQKFQPVSLDDHAPSAKDGAAMRALLRVVRGPQAGVVYELAGDEFTVGRNPQCSIFLNDMTVSRMHASIRYEDGCYVVHDENSFNGVWVNNQNVQVKALKTGDFIQIGAFCLMFEEGMA